MGFGGGGLWAFWAGEGSQVGAEREVSVELRVGHVNQVACKVEEAGARRAPSADVAWSVPALTGWRACVD